ncbi:MAG: hypothetical protein ACKVOK_06395 [Flavobacteriales bacterium]
MKNFPMHYSSWVRPALTLLTVLLLLGDTIHSFRQHYQMCMDGDMTFNVLKSEEVDKILDDPLALKVLLSDEKYLNPNRYFSHLANYTYCWNVPLYLQHFVDPITSIYLSQALFKILLQLTLIFLLASFISPEAKFYRAEFLLPALLVTPFFQTLGFNHQMGIIDKSMTYDFFYAFPIVFILLFFIPVLKSIRTSRSFSKLHFLWMVPCAFIVAFSGPLNLGVAPVICLLCCIWVIISERMKPGEWSWKKVWSNNAVQACAILLLFCGYSLFINAKAGTMAEDIPPLAQRYFLLLQGILTLLTENRAFLWLFLLIGLNLFILRKQNGNADKWLSRARWIALFSLLYIFLLPFGGYRPYRPFILRFDTAMPVTLALVWLFGATAFAIIATNRSRWRLAYYFVVVYSLIYFTQYDKMGDPAYDCEKAMLNEIARSKDTVVKLSEPCTVIEWQTITDFRNSEKQAELLFHWNVTSEKKLFYYDPSSAE